MSQRDKPPIHLKQKLQFRRRLMPLHEGVHALVASRLLKIFAEGLDSLVD
jgi:hypothetical protein